MQASPLSPSPGGWWSMPKMSKNRALAQPFLIRMVREGLSANEALEKLREMGLGYRRTVFLEDWREVAGVDKKKDFLKNIPRKYAFTDASTVEKEWYMRRKYSVVFKVTGTDLQTGERDVERFYTISTDERKPMGLLIDTMDSLVRQKRFEYAFEPTKVEIEVIFRRSEKIPAPWEEEE